MKKKYLHEYCAKKFQEENGDDSIEAKIGAEAIREYLLNLDPALD